MIGYAWGLYRKSRFMRHATRTGFDEDGVMGNIQTAETSDIGTPVNVGMILSRNTHDNHYSVRRQADSKTIFGAVDGTVYKWRRRW